MKYIKIFLLLFIATQICACGVYSFKDVSIDYTKYKTIKIGYIENKARYINPVLSAKLTDNIQQKIVAQTKLSRTNNDEASMILTGFISNYDPSQTVGVSNQASVTNRLTVTVHIVVKKTVENKTDEFDVTRNFDFDANLSLQQAEAKLLDEIIKQVTDEIFNKLFSNW
jgi:Lipopolysaccharide-assembly